MLQRYFCSVNYFALHNTVLYRKILLVFRSITVYSNHTSFHFAYEAWAFVWIKYQIKNHIPPVFHAVCNTAWYWTWYWTYRESSLLLNIKQTQVWVLVGSNRTWWPISMQVSVIIHYGTDLSHRCLLERRLTYFRLDPQEEKPRVDFEYKNSFQGNAYMCKCRLQHYSNVIMSVMVSQITGVSMVCSTICSGANQRKDQSPASLAFVRGIHRWPVNSLHKGPVTRKMFPFDDVIMKMSDILLWVSDVFLNTPLYSYRKPIVNLRRFDDRWRHHENAGHFAQGVWRYSKQTPLYDYRNPHYKPKRFDDRLGQVFNGNLCTSKIWCCLRHSSVTSRWAFFKEVNPSLAKSYLSNHPG